MSEVLRPRRYYLLKRLALVALCEDSDGVWRSKQEAEPGTALPSDFPSRVALVAAGYTTVQDVDGADAAELLRTVALNARQSATVIEAAAALI